LSVAGFWETAVNRKLLAAAAALFAVAAIAYYLWPGGRGTAAILPPPVPDGLIDPPARDLVEGKRRAVLAAAQNGTVWGELAMAFDAHDASAEAMVCYRRAMDLDPKDARWPYLLAGQLNKSGTGPDKEEAVRLLRQSADCPDHADKKIALLSLADLLTELGRGNEATPLYQQVYDAVPSDPWAAYRMGIALADRDETQQAAQVLLSLARNPYARRKSAVAMAELSRRAGRTKDAEGFDYAAGLLPPDYHWANSYTAEVSNLLRGRKALMNRYVGQEAAHDDKACVHTATALADQYPSAETQLMLLRALVNSGDYSGAVAVADDILRDPDGRKLVTAHSFLGLAQLGLADRAEAEGRKPAAERLLAQAAESLGESVRLKADYAPGYIYRAKALLRLGRLPEAEEAARAAVHCRPEEWEGYIALSDVLAAAGRKADAITAADQAVKLAHPNEPRPKQALEALKKK
jgi:tetratricopeptide (TPR) repeat protein